MVDVIEIIAVGGITILASLSTTWINNRSAKRMKLVELTYERREAALRKLYNIASKNFKSYDKLEKELSFYMHGDMGALYLPEKVVKGICRHYALSEQQKKEIPEGDRIARLRNLIQNLTSDYIRRMEK